MGSVLLVPLLGESVRRVRLGEMFLLPTSLTPLFGAWKRRASQGQGLTVLAALQGCCGVVLWRATAHGLVLCLPASIDSSQTQAGSQAKGMATLLGSCGNSWHFFTW